MAFERIGEVRLKGFSEATELFVARPARRRAEGGAQASNVWCTASTLLPSGSKAKAP